MKKLEKAILETICFFDLFDLPLKKEQIRQFLYKKSANSDEVREALKKLVTVGHLEQHDKHYTLAGRGEKIIFKEVQGTADKRIRQGFLNILQHHEVFDNACDLRSALDSS